MMTDRVTMQYMTRNGKYDGTVTKALRALVYEEAFAGLDNNDKMAYIVMLGRAVPAAKDGMADKQGRVFIYFTVEEACQVLKLGRTKIAMVFKALVKVGLIERIPQGFGRPVIIYVKMIVVDENTKGTCDADKSDSNACAREASVCSKNVDNSGTRAEAEISKNQRGPLSECHDIHEIHRHSNNECSDNHEIIRCEESPEDRDTVVCEKAPEISRGPQNGCQINGYPGDRRTVADRIDIDMIDIYNIDNNINPINPIISEHTSVTPEINRRPQNGRLNNHEILRQPQNEHEENREIHIRPLSESLDNPESCRRPQNERLHNHGIALRPQNGCKDNRNCEDTPGFHIRPLSGCQSGESTGDRETGSGNNVEYDINDYIHKPGPVENGDELIKIEFDDVESMRPFCKRMVRKHIDYSNFEDFRPDDLPLVDDIVDVMVDVIMTEDDEITISRIPRSGHFVRSRFMCMKSDVIEYVVDSIKRVTTRIRNLHQYLLTSLYNAPDTIANYYNSVFQNSMTERAEYMEAVYGGV